jgi:hypothetical protein
LCRDCSNVSEQEAAEILNKAKKVACKEVLMQLAAASLNAQRMQVVAGEETALFLRDAEAACAAQSHEQWAEHHLGLEPQHKWLRVCCYSERMQQLPAGAARALQTEVDGLTAELVALECAC